MFFLKGAAELGGEGDPVMGRWDMLRWMLESLSRALDAYDLIVQPRGKPVREWPR